MSQDNFIRIQVVERELVDIDNFMRNFKKRLDARQFPIRVKINEGPDLNLLYTCLLYTSPSPRDRTRSRMPSSA